MTEIIGYEEAFRGYQVALQRIMREKVQKTGTLDLAFLFLSTIPQEITELTHLKSINFSSNRIGEFKILQNLEKLESIVGILIK